VTPKVLICHFNEGAKPTGKLHCAEPGTGAGGYESHVGPLGHGEKDFCILSGEGLTACIGKITEPPPK